MANVVRASGHEGHRVIVDPVETERRIEQRLLALRIDRDARRALAAEQQGVIQPEILSLRERLKRPRAETRWRIDGWMPRQARVMLTAQAKAGKTSLITHVGRSFCDGDDFLGRDLVSATNGAVVVIDTEMSVGQLEAWWQNQRIRRDDKLVLIPLRGGVSSFDILDPQTRSTWAKRLKATNTEVLILDCLRPCLDALGLDEHGEAGRFLTSFDALLREADVEDAIVVHHMGHVNERARGDSRLRDWPDCEWRLVRLNDQPGSPRFLSAYGRDVDQAEAQIAWDAEARRMNLVGGTRQDTKTDQTLEDVLGVLGGESLSQRAIIHAVRETGSTHRDEIIREAITRGVSRGLIVTENGPRRAILHRLIPSASECVPSASHHCVSECVPPSIEGDAHTLNHGNSPDQVFPDALTQHNSGGQIRGRI
jgi:hypothetical protein